MRLLVVLILSLFISSSAIATTPEMLCRDIAEREYPNDLEMQNYVYSKQIKAYYAMQDIHESKIKQIAENEYPNDYSMQQFVYERSMAGRY